MPGWGIDGSSAINSPSNSVGSSSTTPGADGGVGMGLVASGVVSGITSIIGNSINTKRLKNTYDFNKGMIDIQKRMARLTADVEIANIRKKAQSLMSTQRAGYAKAGVAMEGSPVAVMLGSAKEMELSAIYTDISAEYGIASLDTEAGLLQAKAQSAQYDFQVNSYGTILNMVEKGATYAALKQTKG